MNHFWGSNVTANKVFKTKFCFENGFTEKHEICSGRDAHFVCDARHWTIPFPTKLTPRIADLLSIANAVYFVDRVSRRDRQHVDYGWSRSLKLSVEVFDHSFWSSAEVSDCLHSCLEFLSGDEWNIRFLKNAHSFELSCIPFSADWKPISENPTICLYSGGLDSAAGLVRYLATHDSRDIVPLLVRHSHQGKPVTDQLSLINQKLNMHLHPLILPFWMRNPKHLKLTEEDSQRTRSFLFCAAAGLAATLTEAKSIVMLEGGIGAINLPLMSGMIGSKATRSSHPTFLQHFSNLLRLVTNKNLSVELPFRYSTKAELISSLATAGLVDLVPLTVSCVHYPLRKSSAKQCGYCPACIFRRQAILAAGLHENTSTYQYDLFGRHSPELPADKCKYLHAFLLQIDKLSVLDNSDILPQFVLRHLHATEINLDKSTLDNTVSLFRRYRSEWLNIVNIGNLQGWEWASKMGPVLALEKG